MNKKFLSLSLSLFMLISMVDISFAAKKDVSDPVLQQIISELNDRMPRFINKYGAAVFVADEQITRGALLQALYEFDKKSSSSSAAAASTASTAGVISKKDYDALTAKVAALEKKVKSGSGTSSSGGSSEVDIVQIMNDLEPNMPMMLDNSLASSKVFKQLEAKVNAGGSVGASASSGSGVSQSVVKDLQKNINDLNTKVNSMETAMAKNSDSKTNVSSSVLKDLQKNINDLNTKVNTMETTLAKKTDSKSDVSKTTLTDMQKSINDMNSKINNVESSLAALGKDGSKVGSSANNAQVLYEIKNFKNDMNTVNKKIADMETKLASSKGSSSVSNSPTQEEVNSLKKTLVQMQQSYVTLGKRIDSMEKEQSLLASSSSSSGGSASLSAAQIKQINSKINSIREEVDNIKVDTSKISKDSKSSADIKKIEKRLSNLENSDRSGSGSSESGSGSSKTSTVAKVSLGLSLVAALFIAR
ncbi:MAG: hypothetical protein K5622_01145 [Endomicrobiaceae bacterium]|nr:hypothetical protein [Endomicrobiaceae bacterium]